jgi:hypothetical protein
MQQADQNPSKASQAKAFSLQKNSRHAHLLFVIFKNHINIPIIKQGFRSFRAT